MTVATPDAGTDRLQARLERERRARAESEAIAEETLHKLYRKEKEVELLGAIAAAANEARSLEGALQAALDLVCGHTGWPVGHAYLAVADGTGELAPSNLWHLDDPKRFEAFRKVTEATRLARGIGLPGRVLASGKPVWIMDVTVDPNFPRAKAADDIGVRAGFGFPLLVAGEVVGVLEFFSDVALEPDESVLRVMSHAGAQLGRVVERQRARETTEQLIRLQRLESIGKLAGGIAHDFNNLLSVILGRSQLMVGRLRPDDPSFRHVSLIIETAQRAAALTRQLLAFGRKQVLQPQVLDVNAAIAGMETILRRLIPESIELRTVLAPALGHLRADPPQLEQVLMNLVANARDAMPRGGRLTIETANVDLDRAYARQHAGVTPGSYVMLSVQDTGIGMDRATRARIFEPFFTTKELGKGTGLGLATVYGIVKQSEGNIWVYSEPGLGTTFRVYLPRVDTAPTASPAEPATTTRGRGSETILVVEDEDGLRSLVREVLEAEGYRVLGAGGAREALSASRQHEGAIDLLLTDVVMPELSGKDLVDHLSAERAGLRVLYMSGYAGGTLAHHGVLNPDVALIEKPFTVEGMLRKVREVLDAPPDDKGPS